MQHKIGKLKIESHNDYLGNILSKGELYEFEYLKFSISQLDPNKSGAILDIGANIGNHTLYWLYKGFSVISFEPILSNFKILHKNIFQNNLSQRSEIYQFGLGQKEENIDLQIFGHNMGACRQGIGGENVRIKVLDDYDFGVISMIKIDVEGMEMEVLRGGIKTINKYKPDLMVEINSEETMDYIINILGYTQLFRHGKNKTIYFKYLGKQ